MPSSFRSGVSARHAGRHSRRGVLRAGVAVVAGTALLPIAGFPRPVVANAQDHIVPTANTARRYFAQTGHNLNEPFLTRWEAAGGEAIIGAPLSEERYTSGAGGVLQTFTGLTLVYDPAQEAPWNVRGQPLESAIIDEIAPASARRPVTGCGVTDPANCLFFPATGHSLSGRLAEFWAASGGQPIFGLPVSEPFADEGRRSAAVQVFENAVLDDRGPAGVALRPMGKELMTASGQQGDPAFEAAPPTGGSTFLVAASDGLRLRNGPTLGSEMVALLPDNAEFIAATPWQGDWVPGYTDGFSGWVSFEYLSEAPPLPQIALADWNPSVWQGGSLGETNVRAKPTTDAKIVEELAYGDAVTVDAWVKGEELFEGADLWAKIGPNRFVYARNIGRNAPVMALEPPADAPTVGQWIDVDLTQQLLTAYDGRTPIRTAVTTTGMAGWETPPGYYQILNRVANETMTSGAIGAEHFYKLEDVLFTQYFTDRGHALHFAWWRTKETIGRPGSHGCLNLLLDDARFFWDWATYGTPVYVHP